MSPVRATALEVRDLCFSADQKQILDHLDLSVLEREIVGIIGASGSGKSTLIKCAAGLLGPDSGSIKLSGRQLVGISPGKLPEVLADVGFVFQYSALFDSMTVLENIALAPIRRFGCSRRESETLVREMLAHVQLSGIENYYPSELSGGMAKRVGLARALAYDPRIVFYDEPTSGLDPPTARSIDRLIVHVRDSLNVTSVVVTHDLAALSRFADRIALLENGRIALAAPPKDFVSSGHPSVARYVESQSAGFESLKK